MALHTNRLLSKGATYISLFSGVGAADLGFRLANPTARCVCYCERETYPAAVLVQRMQEKILDDAPLWDNVEQFPCEQFVGKVDGLLASPPCQSASITGKRRGTEDERWLWDAAIDIVEQTRPSTVFFENVAGLVSGKLLDAFRERICGRLEKMDYRIAAGLFTAKEVGAPHQRERIFILGYSHSKRLERWGESFPESPDEWAVRQTSPSMDERDRLANTLMRAAGSQSQKPTDENGEEADHSGYQPATLSGWTQSQLWLTSTERTFPPGPCHPDWKNILRDAPGLSPALSTEEIKSLFRGVVDGDASQLNDVRVEKTRAIGNSLVPLVASYSYRVLEEALIRSIGEKDAV